MHPVSALERLGGVGTRRAVLRLTDEADLTRAIASGDIVRDARGRLALPGADADLRCANALSATLSHLSAARFWGWPIKTPPSAPHVTVPRNRRVARERRRGIQVHWADLGPEDVRAPGVSSPMRTVLDCALTLPFDEALVVADSALRQEDLTATSLSEAAARLRGAGRVRATRIAAAASPLAANPFESVLRAIALEVPGLSVVPQVSIAAPGFFARPDLVDVERRLVLEADSHAWHSSRSALRRDCRRYNGLVLLGWTVLRFTWEDVMAYPDLVTDDLVRAVEHAELPRTHR